MVEAKNENSVIIKETGIPGELIIGEGKDAIKTKCGCVFSENHYGFIFTTLDKGEMSYSTQCPIFGVEVDNGLLKVWEDGKVIPWRVDMKNGEVVDYAKFSSLSRRDIQYLEEKFGLGIEDLDKVNSYFDGDNRLRKHI